MPPRHTMPLYPFLAWQGDATSLPPLILQATSAIAMSEHDPLSEASEQAIRSVADAVKPHAAAGRDPAMAQWLMDVASSVLVGSAERAALGSATPSGGEGGADNGTLTSAGWVAPNPCVA
jgi:hypothetical protein